MCGDAASSQLTRRPLGRPCLSHQDAVEILTRLTTQSPEMRSRVKAGLPAYTQDLLVHAKSKFMPKSRASQACDQLLRLLRPSSISN